MIAVYLFPVYERENPFDLTFTGEFEKIIDDDSTNHPAHC